MPKLTFHLRCNQQRLRSARALTSRTQALHREEEAPLLGGRASNRRHARSARALNRSTLVLSRESAAHPLVNHLHIGVERQKRRKEWCEVNALFRGKRKHCPMELTSFGCRTV